MSSPSPGVPGSLTLERAFEQCEALTPTQQRRVLRLLGLPTTALEISGGAALVIWTADLLQRTPINDPDQRWLVLEELAPILQDYGNQLLLALYDSASPELPVTRLGLGDRRYVFVTGQDRLLDLDSGSWQTNRKRPFFETVIYDLAHLFILRERAHHAPAPTPS